MNNSEAEIWKTVREMNSCWTGGDPKALEKLSLYFHRSMVAITPEDRLRLEGKNACILSWRRFVEKTTIHHWNETEPYIHIYGQSTAVVTYYWEIVYDLAGRKIKMGGRDMLTLIIEDGRWQVVADQFSPYPKTA